MLTKNEEDFIAYWAANRERKKKSIWQFSFGLPLGVMIVLLLFVNIASGWYKRADMLLRSNASLIITILIAAVGIVIFISVFSAKYQWEQNEQRYQELLYKKKHSEENETQS